MRWYGWTAVVLSWMVTTALLIATAQLLLPPQQPVASGDVAVSTAVKMP
jgi:hypothetical protein